MASQEIPLIGPLIQRIFGTVNERVVKRYYQRVDAVGRLEESVSSLTDAELRAKTESFRERVASGESLNDMIDEALAVAREAMDRNVGIRNAFNPAHREAFEADRLPEAVRAVYEETLAAMDAAEPAPPEGDFLGCEEPQPAWVWHDIPVEFYKAVRELYPKSRPPFRARPFDVQLIGLAGAAPRQDRRDEDGRGQDDRRAARLLPRVHRRGAGPRGDGQRLPRAA